MSETTLTRRELLKRAGALGLVLSFPALARPAAAPAAAEPATPTGTWILVGADDSPPFLNGWGALEGDLDALRFRVDSGVVTLRGSTVGGKDLEPIFRLPADCRPAHLYRLPWAEVEPEGHVRPRIILNPDLAP